MTERELLALMASALYRDTPTHGMITAEKRAVSEAKYILEAVDEELRKQADRT